MNLISRILFDIFLRIGGKFFNTVSIYSPDDGEVLAVHFATSEQNLAKSCHEISENSIK